MKVSPSYKRDGLCVFCEIYLINYLFTFFKLKNESCVFILNKYRCKVDEPGEYSSKYMNFQHDSKCYGLYHFYPLYKKNVYHTTTKKGKNGSKLKGLVERGKDVFF